MTQPATPYNDAYRKQMTDNAVAIHDSTHGKICYVRPPMPLEMKIMIEAELEKVLNYHGFSFSYYDCDTIEVKRDEWITRFERWGLETFSDSLIHSIKTSYGMRLK